jgi:hypothetical protein
VAKSVELIVGDRERSMTGNGELGGPVGLLVVARRPPEPAARAARRLACHPGDIARTGRAGCVSAARAPRCYVPARRGNLRCPSDTSILPRAGGDWFAVAAGIRHRPA